MSFAMIRAAGLAVMMFGAWKAAGAQSPPESQIYWVQSPQRAMAMARESKAPILAFVSSENCGYCRKMEREVWTNRDIISQVQSGFVPLNLEAERDAKLIASLGIRAFPTTLIFTSDGKVIGGAPGFLPPNHLAGLLRAALRDDSTLRPLPPTQ